MIWPRKPFFFAFLPLFLLAGYLALIYQLSLIFAAFSLLGVMCVVAVIMSWLGLADMRASRSHPPEAVAGVPFSVRVTIENRMPALSSQFFTVEDALQRDHTAKPQMTAILSLDPAEQTQFSYSARIDRRGEYRFSAVRLASRFPFGMFEKRRTLDAPSTLLVLPRPGTLARDVVREQPAPSAETPVAVRGGMGEFHNVRPFQPGDTPRWVHWATSARKGGTWVREFEREIDRRLLIVFDAAPQEHFERAITMCATLADHYLNRGYRVALAVIQEKPVWLSFGAGPDHLRRILRALAPVQPAPAERRSQWDPREVRGAQIAVVGPSVPAGLSALGASLTSVAPDDPALREHPVDGSL